MKERETVILALDKLGLALAGHNHKWTVEERELYDRAIALLATVGCEHLQKLITREDYRGE
jgi:hypothetical protein